MHDAKNIINIWEISESDTLCHSLPLFHVHGLCFALHTALISGAHVVLFDRFTPEIVLDILKENKTDLACSIFMGVPAMYSKLIDVLKNQTLCFDHMRLWTSGSAPLPVKEFQRIKQIFGKEPVEREGMSETGILLGMFLVAVMPTTISSGVGMTGNADGNMAHALFVTIVSNCIAIVSIPLVLSIFLLLQQQDTVLSIDQKAIIVKLLILVLLPLITGMFLKKMVFNITANRKKIMGIINQCCVICIVFMSLSGVKEILISKSSSFFLIVPLVIVFHLCLLGFFCLVSRLLNIGKGKRESVIFMGSQKTLPLSVML
ncbi:MAG: bile acid:sodium symporter [Desulfobacula sp.]|uniref:bile acid:sodium symporter n=1 Tax=Desulfobacula sp. TaxID=2593537 RepID=UPI0025C1424F|nr:bile acid:sodium symporter [Desulfobacula sp.]MCD4723044.1 bile acid:sodium symporter [Desulfobacula sp.]